MGDAPELSSPRRDADRRGRAASGETARTTPIPAPTRRALAAARAVEDTVRLNVLETAFAFDRTTGRELFREEGTQDRVEFSSQQVHDMQGNVITHNHPDGGSFSEADIRLAAFAEVAEARLITAEWRYSMRPPADGWNAAWWRDVLVREHGTARAGVLAEVIPRMDRRELTREEGAELTIHETWVRVADGLGMHYTRTRVRR